MYMCIKFSSSSLTEIVSWGVMGNGETTATLSLLKLDLGPKRQNVFSRNWSQTHIQISEYFDYSDWFKLVT